MTHKKGKRRSQGCTAPGDDNEATTRQTTIATPYLIIPLSAEPDRSTYSYARASVFSSPFAHFISSRGFVVRQRFPALIPLLFDPVRSVVREDHDWSLLVGFSN